MVVNNSEKKTSKEPIETNLLIIADKPGVKEELIKENIWNMHLEAWIDKEGKEKIDSWIVEKGEFNERNLSQNKILNSAIIGERNKMVMLRIQKDDKDIRNTIRKLQGINITEALSIDDKSHEAWLLERNKVENSLVWKEINNSESSAQELLNQKYFDKLNTTKIILGYNSEEKLTGELIIRDFPNLEVINITNAYENFVSNKRINELKIINCPELRELSCRFHELTELDTSKFSNLTYLDCQVNKIESLNLSKNTQLNQLVCVNNRLTEIDLKQNVQLTELLCYENYLVNLDLRKNVNLTWLECFRNPLKISNIKISEKINYFGAYPLVFLVRQGEDVFLTAKKKEWDKLVTDYEKKHYEMERIDISDLNNLVEQLNLKNIEDQEFLSKFIPQNLAKVAEKKIIYCLSLRIILDNLANQIKYRCLVFRNRLCEGENKEYEEQLRKWASDWQKCGFMRPRYYLPAGGIESLVDRYTYPFIEGGEELRRKVGHLPYVKID